MLQLFHIVVKSNTTCIYLMQRILFENYEFAEKLQKIRARIHQHQENIIAPSPYFKTF